jgi:phospholipid N-methyltransferase
MFRKALIKQMLANSQVMFSQRQSQFYQRAQPRHDDDIIEGEIVDDDDKRHLS